MVSILPSQHHAREKMMLFLTEVLGGLQLSGNSFGPGSSPRIFCGRPVVSTTHMAGDFRPLPAPLPSMLSSG